jgi:predicted GH43/DUF377 family glycosyl hydrolase
METFQRISENPIVRPDANNKWEAVATFNPSVVKMDGKFHLLYRALSAPADYKGHQISISTIGYTQSYDGIHFSDRRQLIKPDEQWEIFGCEDPRITYCDGKYYIFYTALAGYPFSSENIRIGVAITADFQKFDKHPVTRFNSKAMALFPEKINGRYAAILTVHSDLPPAKIALAFFDKEEDIWSEKYWTDWYADLNDHIIPLLRNSNDHVEVGAQPVKTDKGWLIIYSYIQNYFSDNKIFGIEAVLLDLHDPLKIIGKTCYPILLPEKEYELHGDVPNITFPSGLVLENDKLMLYYGAADTTSCLAIGDLKKTLKELCHEEKIIFSDSKWIRQSFKRYAHNPIISPRPEFPWEAKATFNPAVIYENNKFHIVYRAMSFDDTSVFGYATSSDGVHIDERSTSPIYEPRAAFEKKLCPGNSGCEDPRITRIDDELYMFYTAFDGYTPRVAFTSIKVKDFLNKQWNWTSPNVITPPNISDKDACLLSKKIKGKYVIFHRAYDNICINMEDGLNFNENNWLEHQTALIKPRKIYWDNSKFGIAAPPIETQYGWLMFYHRATISCPSVYKVEAALLALDNPSIILSQTDATLLEPEMEYEERGIVSNVVFPCGAVLLNGIIYLYYGGADKVIGVAKMELNDILKRFGICIDNQETLNVNIK